MPSISSGKVLVTGANGFIAGWITKHLLENGFSVRATVRSSDKADILKPIFSGADDRLEFVVIEDLAAVRTPSRFLRCS